MSKAKVVALKKGAIYEVPKYKAGGTEQEGAIQILMCTGSKSDSKSFKQQGVLAEDLIRVAGMFLSQTEHDIPGAASAVEHLKKAIGSLTTVTKKEEEK